MWPLAITSISISKSNVTSKACCSFFEWDMFHIYHQRRGRPWIPFWVERISQRRKRIRWNCIDQRVCDTRSFENSLLTHLFSSVFTCTANGMLRKSMFTAEQQKDPFKISESHCSTLPSRLFDWRLSEDAQTFAYGGDEVNLSVWNTGIAFETRSIPASSSNTIKKRKRNDDLFPGEIWRARNVRFFKNDSITVAHSFFWKVPNDHLNLRQPVRITALSYLPSSAAGYNLVVGTQFGDMRRYDTRAARRPVSNWTAMAKVGGIKSIQKGLADQCVSSVLYLRAF